MDYDIALAYDPGSRRCDLVFDGTDFAFDTTPATALLISTGTDARALPSDELPDFPQPPFNTPTRLDARGGWPGDALDRLGRTIGSRCWVFRRSKQNETVRRGYAQALADSLAWRQTQLGRVVGIVCDWIAPNTLGSQVVDGATTITLQQATGS
jgi:phage gp46-like protein